MCEKIGTGVTKKEVSEIGGKIIDKQGRKWPERKLHRIRKRKNSLCVKIDKKKVVRLKRNNIKGYERILHPRRESVAEN